VCAAQVPNAARDKQRPCCQRTSHSKHDAHMVGPDLYGNLYGGAGGPLRGDGAFGKLATNREAGVAREEAAAHTVL
jgi:hypothetical protein